MMSGHAYARAVRGHTITVSALLIMVLKPYVDSLSDEQVSELLKLSESGDFTAGDFDPIWKNLKRWYEERKNFLKAKSWTGPLWVL